MKARVKKYLWGPFFFLVLLLLAGGIFLLRKDGLGNKISDRRSDAIETRVPVTVALVDRGKVEQKISLSGTLYPKAEVVLYPKISGRVKTFWVDRGDQVTAEQLLMKLEDRELILEVREAKAALEVNLAQLAQLEAGSRPEEIAQSQSKVRRMEAAYEKARTDWIRMEGLAQQGVVSREQLDEARLHQDTTLEELHSSKEELSLILQGPREEDKKAAAAQVRKARATLELAKERLHDASIFAPFEGIISKRNIEIGTLVSPSTPLFSLVQINEIKARAGVTEREVSLIKIGLPAEVQVDGYPEVTFPGRITQISPIVHPDSRTFEVEVSLDNRSEQLKPGMYARIDLLIQQRKDVLRIPLDAIMEINSKFRVFLHQEGKAKLLTVSKGLEDSDSVEILEGSLKEGDEVILTGLKGLQDGASVIVTQRDVE